MENRAVKRKGSPWFAFYPDDFDGGTADMSLAATGAFVRLLNYQFSRGSVPKNDEKICRILRATLKEWRAIRDEVLSKFEEREAGELVNPRMDNEREIRDEIREKRVAASAEGNKKRWGAGDFSDPKTVPNGIANGTSNGKDLRVATTTTSPTTYSELPPRGANSSSASAGAMEVFQELDSETLAKQGKSLESLSARLALPVDSFVAHGASLGLSETKVRQWADSRVANNWSTAKNKPLTPVTWPADMNGFAAASQEISSKQNNGKDNRSTSRNDNTANAGRASAFAKIGKLES
jgi:uncharacterized protein YdaU (DUF1376 family)